MRYRLGTTLILSVFLTALVASLGGATELRGGSLGVACRAKATYVHAFHVEAEWVKLVYRRSEKADVTVTVTRPAHEDPAGLGVPTVPPISVPEAGVTVWTTISTGSYPFPYGYGQTDAQGQVHFKIPLKLLKPGAWDVAHSAEKWTNQGGCPDIVEWGYLYESPGITVTP